MKRWCPLIISVPLVALLSIVIASTAHAQAVQDFAAVPPEIANVLVKMGVITDGVLSHWVSGNTLTADGGSFVNALAQTVVNTTHFLAELVTLF